jgi:guanylate kinase
MKESSAVSDTSPDNPVLLVLSGPSGAGKDTVLNRIKAKNRSLYHVTTVTTRYERAGELNGREYHFISRDKFSDMIKSNSLLEWAEVYGNYYGVPKKPVKQAIERGQDVVIKVDIQGAAAIKKLVPQAITIFLTPASINDLLKRLTGRRSESATDLQLRARTAEEEMRQMSTFDYTVINEAGKIDNAVSEIEAIIAKEKNRTGRQKIEL